MGLLEIKALLYGDLLLASGHDCALLAAVHLPLFLLGLIFLKPLLYVFLDRNCSQILNLPVRLLEIAFFISAGTMRKSSISWGMSPFLERYLMRRASASSND